MAKDWLQRIKRLATQIAFVAGVLLLVISLAFPSLYTDRLNQYSDDFYYDAQVVSYDNFYDETTQQFTGETLSQTDFYYDALYADGNTLTIQNVFDVRRVDGSRIFSTERLYGINARTGEHTTGGDHARNGYLFAPSNLKKQDFMYWHVNYDVPVTMKFQNEQDILGVTTYRYAADFKADQTRELSDLPEVGETRGINLDAHLELWVEPKTGYLVKYEDRASAYYYDLQSGIRLHPWNQFRNKYTYASIVEHTQIANQRATVATIVDIFIPAFGVTASVVILFCASWVSLGKRRYSGIRRGEILGTGAVLLMAAVSLFFWASGGRDVTLPDWALPMYPGAAVGIAVVLIVHTLLSTPGLTLKLWQRMVLGVALILVILRLASVLADHFLGVAIGLGVLTVEIGGVVVPLVLPNFALCLVLFCIVLLLKLFASGKWSQRLQEVLVAICGLVALMGLLSFAYSSRVVFVQEWMQQITFAGTVAVLIAVLLFIVREKKWLVRQILVRVGSGGALALLVLVAALSITGIVWQSVLSSNERQENLNFQDQVNTIQSSVQSKLASLASLESSGVGLLNASEEVTEAEWQAYGESIQVGHNYPGVRSYGFASSREGVQIDNAPVELITPQNDANQVMKGFNLANEPVLRNVMAAARDSGEPTVSHALFDGFAIFAPVYKQQTYPGTVQERRAAIRGYVFALVKMDVFMQVIANELSGAVDIEIFDTDVPDRLEVSRLFGVSPSGSISLQDNQIVDEHGAAWTIRYSASSEYGIHVSPGPAVGILSTGLAFSLAAAMLVYVLGSSRKRALAFADRATQDLAEERDRAVSIKNKDEAILNSVSDGLIVFDAQGEIERVNRPANEMLKLDDQDLLHKPYYEVLSAYDESKNKIPREKRPINKVLDSGQTFENVRLWYSRDGKLFPVQLSAAPIVRGKKVIGAIQVFRDVTKQDLLNKAKDEFLSLASHQLRTPLTAIGWYSEMLLSGDVGRVPAKQRELLQEIHQGKERMNDLVDSLLNVSRFELGRFSLKPEEINLKALAQNAISELRPVIEEKNLIFDDETASNLPAFYADPKVVQMIVQNYLSNAVKYTERGSVTFSIREATQNERQKSHLAASGRAITIQVTDTGRGVPKRQQSKIFTKLFRADNVRSLDVEGTGLGLYIARLAAKELGGRVWFESVEGKGSTFYATIGENSKGRLQENKKGV